MVPQILIEKVSVGAARGRNMSLSKPAKIGIITVWKWICRQDNYGSVLQAWALKTVLERLGYQPEILRLASTQEERYREDALRVKFKYLRLLFTWGRKRRKLLTRIRRFEHPCRFMELVRKELPLPSWNASLAEASERSYEAYDALIVGSDQVWSGVVPVYFLNVRPGPELRLAYAVSRNWPKGGECFADALCQWIKGKGYTIGCREKIGVDVCIRGGIPATWVCDPTLLLANAFCAGDDGKHLCLFREHLFKVAASVLRGARAADRLTSSMDWRPRCRSRCESSLCCCVNAI